MQATSIERTAMPPAAANLSSAAPFDVEAADRMARLDQILGHGQTHIAQADEADLGHVCVRLSVRVRLPRRCGRSGMSRCAAMPSTMARALGPSARTAAT